MNEHSVDVLIVGEGTCGCTAALGATAMGFSVIMTEEPDWLGGQLTSQAVPPDENSAIETYGGTGCYREFRTLVREYYKTTLSAKSSSNERSMAQPRSGQCVKIMF
jgi:NADPH-dependent 2,4-dienoyl-CoA reductase/sulfur reductase-like enzyme